MNKLRTKNEKPKTRPVTLIIGIICKDGIVMAGDSQTTWDTGKSWSANKMREIKYGQARVLVAESGATLTSTDAVESLARMAEDPEMSSNHSLPELAELAIKSVRDKLRFQNFECTSEELQNFIGRNGLECELMVAHYSNGPKIHTVRLTMGVASPARLYFETVGCGSDLANYLLTDLCEPNHGYRINTLIAAHVVETVKRHDPYCGGPVKLGVLRADPDDSPLIFDQRQTDNFVQLVSRIDAETKQSRLRIMQDALEQEAEKEFARVMDELTKG
jgi:20S proteasome alpha/beta subunit